MMTVIRDFVKNAKYKQSIRFNTGESHGSVIQTKEIHDRKAIIYVNTRGGIKYIINTYNCHGTTQKKGESQKLEVTHSK